jgi:hypothetical protein
MKVEISSQVIIAIAVVAGIVFVIEFIKRQKRRDR